jgi:hypothetical protein
LGYLVKVKDFGGTCSKYVDHESLKNFYFEEGNVLGILVTDGKIILRCTLKKQCYSPSSGCSEQNSCGLHKKQVI